MTALLYGTLQRIPDSKGSEYLAVVLRPHQSAMLAAWVHLTGMGLDEAIAARHLRDGPDNAHITVASVMEWGGLSKNFPDVASQMLAHVGTDTVLVLHGIGQATSPKTGSTAWFGIVSCPYLVQLRERMGLRPKDLHVTMAFSPKDVFDASKGLDALLVPVSQFWSPTQTEPSLYEGAGPC